MLGIMVVEGFGGSVVGGCGDARDFGAVGLWSSVGVGGDVVGLVGGCYCTEDYRPYIPLSWKPAR